MVKSAQKISKCDVFWCISIDTAPQTSYNRAMITLQDLRLISESYTREPWGGKELASSFSRLYYVLDGEAYYEEGGRRVKLQKHHLYLTPVKQKFGLCDNPRDQLLHTYAHITTLPAITRFTEICVEPDTPLFDAVTLWRRHIHSKDKALQCAIVQLLLSCIEPYLESTPPKLCERIRTQLEHMQGDLDMHTLSNTLGYTREHLTRAFQEVYHTTPHRYYNARRMERAAERLLQGAQVGLVAEELHFSSAYAFSKAFKKHFGLSPRQYVTAAASTLQIRHSTL